MTSHKIHLNDETVINDAVRLHKFAFIDLYHKTFKSSIREAEYAWHKCRASRAGRLLTMQVGAEPISEERAKALAAAVPKPPKPKVTKDWRVGDVISFVDRYGKTYVTPLLRLFVHTDDREYVLYRNERGSKSQIVVSKVTLVERKNKK